jgi:glycerol-3-phosphate acyltransferase PlsX
LIIDAPVAVDAMGGDYAPKEIVRGAAEGSEQFQVPIVLVGDEAAIKANIPTKLQGSPLITIHPTSEVIGMDEHVDAIRSKRDSSIVQATLLVKRGEASYMLGFGNTACTMASPTARWGKLSGIDRPAIATVWPGKDGPTILLDAGANADCTAQNLLEFALMGGVYAHTAFGIAKPKIALLSIGEEKVKGSKLVIAAHELMEHAIPADSFVFIGNLESRDLLNGVADVITTDGFTGNVALKLGEGLMESLADRFQSALHSSLAMRLAYIPLAMLCLLYTSPSPRDRTRSRMPSSA